MTKGSRTQTVATHSVWIPEQFEIAGVRNFVLGLLGDVQDLVSMHLHEPWPLTAGGHPTHPWAELKGSSVGLGFRASHQADGGSIALPDFTLPDVPPTVVRAG